MQYLRQKLQPIKESYDAFLNGSYLKDLLRMKGGSNSGTDYVSKVFQAQTKDIWSEYEFAQQMNKNPTLFPFLTANLINIIFRNALERVVSATQAYPVLIAQMSFPGTTSHIVTEIMNEGAIAGPAKGIALLALQTAAVLYPAVYIANKASEETRMAKFVTTYTLLDFIMHPIDSIKTVLQAETHGKLKMSNIASNISLRTAYAGFFSKFLFNLPYASALYLTASGDNPVAANIAWLITGLAYPTLTIKARLQLSTTQLSSNKGQIYADRSYLKLYKGFVPFFLINYAFCWSLAPLFSQSRLEDLKTNSISRIKQEVGLRI